METKYGNWMPKEMVIGTSAATAVLTACTAAAGIKAVKTEGCTWKIAAGALGLSAAACGAFAVYSVAAHQAFSYDGKRQLSRAIIKGIASNAKIPAGGTGLDVGCGSGALTIACAKNNPDAMMIGVDLWGVEYPEFSKEVCEQNAEAEQVTNTAFEQGNAVKLEYADETFDFVTSNYCYHNIAGKNKQELLRETLRVLKKGGTFAIHDLMSKARYGDMNEFIKELRKSGYHEVRLIDTTELYFESQSEAKWLMLGGSRLLVGTK